MGVGIGKVELNPNPMGSYYFKVTVVTSSDKSSI